MKIREIIEPREINEGIESILGPIAKGIASLLGKGKLTNEQITKLLSPYVRNGKFSPTADELTHITDELKKYGFTGDISKYGKKAVKHVDKLKYANDVAFIKEKVDKTFKYIPTILNGVMKTLWIEVVAEPYLKYYTNVSTKEYELQSGSITQEEFDVYRTQAMSELINVVAGQIIINKATRIPLFILKLIPGIKSKITPAIETAVQAYAMNWVANNDGAKQFAIVLLNFIGDKIETPVKLGDFASNTVSPYIGNIIGELGIKAVDFIKGLFEKDINKVSDTTQPAGQTTTQPTTTQPTSNQSKPVEPTIDNQSDLIDPTTGKKFAIPDI